MAIKKISEFVSAIPASDSKILFEQNEKGKSCSIGDAVNTCSLSYEEIMATDPEPDLTNKVASASALKKVATIDLLWENALPTNEFPSQTISLDLSKYKYVVISVNLYRQAQDRNAYFFSKINDGITLSITHESSRFRTANIQTNGITFGTVKVYNTYGDNTVADINDFFLIPNKIYGIK